MKQIWWTTLCFLSSIVNHRLVFLKMCLVFAKSWGKSWPWFEETFPGTSLANKFCFLGLHIWWILANFGHMRYEICCHILSPYLGCHWGILQWTCHMSLGYAVCVCFLRTFFGAPLSRRRLFIVMIRSDVLKPLPVSLDDYILDKLTAQKQTIQLRWFSVST